MPVKEKLQLSIVIATYNSAKLLGKCLQAIAKQSLSPNTYEVIIVDGGSTDSTIEVAKQYSAKVINNPKKEPVWAKFLGLQQARGKYLMYLDSDEIIVSKHSLKNKIAAFSSPDVKCVTGSGYLNPKDMPFVNTYINEFGDPFSFFIYRLSKHALYFLTSMMKQYSHKKYVSWTVFSFNTSKQLPIVELAAMASVTDIEYLKQLHPEITKNMSLLPHHFYLLMQDKKKLAVLHDDPLLHYSSDTLSNYIKKITWRIKNNVYHIETLGKSGFSGREQFQPESIRLRRYLFIPYAASLFFPLLDSLYLIYTRKDWRFIVHLPLTLITATAIMYHLVLFNIGYRPSIQAYGKK